MLSQTLGKPLAQLRQIPGVGDVLRSFDPLAQQLGKFAKNAGQFSRGEAITDTPTIREIETGVRSAKRGLEDGY